MQGYHNHNPKKHNDLEVFKEILLILSAKSSKFTKSTMLAELYIPCKKQYLQS